MPVLTLVIVIVPYIARMMRAAMIESLESDYVEMACLEGLSTTRIVLIHALPNAIAPTIQVVGLNVLYLAGGIVVVEYIFDFPGIGQGLVSAVSNRDIPVIQLIVVVLATVSGGQHHHRRDRAPGHPATPVREVVVAVATPATPVSAARVRHHQWLATLIAATRTRRGAVGLTLTTVVVLIAFIGPFVASHPPNELEGLPFAKPYPGFPLGTDVLGRDALSRVLNGGWVLLIMAFLATVFGVVVGGAAGIAGAYPRRWDGIIMRTVDVLLAFPQLVFALLLVSIIGPSSGSSCWRWDSVMPRRWPGCCDRRCFTCRSGRTSRHQTCRALRPPR